MKQVFLSFYKIFNRHQKGRMLTLFVMMVIGAILETMGISLIFPFVSLILDADSIYTNRFMYTLYKALKLKSSQEFLILIGIGLIFLYVFKNLFLYFMYSVQYRFASDNRLQMSSGLFSIYLNKPYQYYLQKSSAEIIRNINIDVANVFSLLTTLLQMMTEIVTAAGLAVVLLAVDVPMTVFVVVLLTAAVCVMKYIFKPIQNLTGVRVRDSEAEIMKWLNQSVHGIKEVKVTESEIYFWNHYHRSGRVSAEATRKFNVINTIPQLFIELVFMVGIISYILFLLVSGQDVSGLVPQISTFAMAAIRLLPIANRLNRYMGTIAHLMPSLDNVEREIQGGTPMARETVKEIEPVPRLEQEIYFQHVSFRYANCEKWVLKDATFSIPVGRSIGIIGASGSGKTTLIDLLLGLLGPEQGKILADGREIGTEDKNWLERIGYISQSMYLTEDTLRRNIAFGVEDEEIDDRKIEQVIRMAQLKGYIDSLPNGINTTAGEFGTRMSGGQKQRLCIARALYSDPEILILDEATSALDHQTEADIMENIRALKGKVTMIIIAHRLKTIEDCDLVYRITDGQIEKVG